MSELAIARPPTARELVVDAMFEWLARSLAWFTIAIVFLIVALIAWQALPTMRTFGFAFIGSTTWDAGKGKFGILPEISGTILSSAIGVTVGSVFGLSMAIFLTQELLPVWLENVAKNVVSLLAAIPSVVYGLWGIFVVIPVIRPPCNWLHAHFGWIPFFSTPLLSVGILPAALVLAIMILPTVAAISRDALAGVDPILRETAYGLGATRWETIVGILLPAASPGIFGSIVLAFGRAIGETMALAMLVGGANVISPSIFAPGNTLAALLANKFPEAASATEVGVLMYAALVLLALTLLVNLIGELVMHRQVLAGADIVSKPRAPNTSVVGET